MTSEIRTNSLKSRAGLSTVTFTDSGPMFSGITTFVDNSTFSVGTGGTIHAPATNVMALGTNNIDAIKIDSSGNVNVSGILTASSISGGVSLSNGSNNRVVTATGAAALTGEANLTFDGSKLVLAANSTAYDAFQVGDGLFIGNTTNNVSAAIFHQGGGADLEIGAQDAISFTTGSTAGNATERLRILSNGTVGINTSATNRILTINDTLGGGIGVQGSNAGIFMGAHATGGFTNNASMARAAAANYHITGSAVGDFCIASESTKDIIFGTGATAGAMAERLRITSDGKLLVAGADNYHGDADDLVLKERSGGNVGMTFQNTGTGYGVIYFADSGSQHSGRIQYDHSNNSLDLFTNGNETFSINSSGDVKVTNGWLEVQGGGLAFLTNSSTIKTGSSSYMLGIQGGATYMGGRIELRGGQHGSSGDIRFFAQGATSTQAERLRITSDGTIRIGTSLTTAAAGRFQVVEERGGQQANDCNAYFETNANDWNIKTYYNSSGTHYHMAFIEQGSFRGRIQGNDGSDVSYLGGSDYRWKENIVDLSGSEGIEICKKLKPRKFNWIENREETGQINMVDGFIAHEVVEAGVLGAVTGEKDAVNEDGSIDGQMLAYGKMTPVLAAAIKGLIDKVEKLEQENIALMARVKDLASLQNYYPRGN